MVDRVAVDWASVDAHCSHCPVTRLYVQLHLSSKHHSSVSSARDVDHVTLGFGNIGANTAIFSVVNGEPLHERIVGPPPSSAQEIPIHASVAAYSYLGCKKSFESSPSSPSLAVMTPNSPSEYSKI